MSQKNDGLSKLLIETTDPIEINPIELDYMIERIEEKALSWRFDHFQSNRFKLRAIQKRIKEKPLKKIERFGNVLFLQFANIKRDRIALKLTGKPTLEIGKAEDLKFNESSAFFFFKNNKVISFSNIGKYSFCTDESITRYKIESEKRYGKDLLSVDFSFSEKTIYLLLFQIIKSKKETNTKIYKILKNSLKGSNDSIISNILWLSNISPLTKPKEITNKNIEKISKNIKLYYTACYSSLKIKRTIENKIYGKQICIRCDMPLIESNLKKDKYTYCMKCQRNVLQQSSS